MAFNPFLHYHSQALPDRIVSKLKFFTTVGGLRKFAVKQGVLHFDDITLAEEVLREEVFEIRPYFRSMCNLFPRYATHPNVAMCRGPFADDQDDFHDRYINDVDG